MRIWSAKSFLFLFLVSAIPIGYFVSLEIGKPATHVYHYHSGGWMRECAKWDDQNRRFLVSFMEGGVGQVSEGAMEKVAVVKDVDLAGNGSFGIVVDRPRNRLLVVSADLIGNRYGILTAYDLSTWARLFVSHLAGPGDEKSFANDVAVDAQGNAYVTDCRGSKIWKVGVNGDLVSTIRSPLFTPKEWYKRLIGLNGVVYHPNDYLLAVHTNTGRLFKIDISNGSEEPEVKLVKVSGGSLVFGDGLELVTPTRLVVAGSLATRLVESSNGWETASVVSGFAGALHRVATAATVKDGKVYVNHVLGMGYPKKKHALVEAVFKS